MHQDQKIGLAFAVLLIGFAGAFCFRHEPIGPARTMALQGAEELDARIEHLPVRAYIEREGVAGSHTTAKDVQHPISKDGPLADVLEIGRSPKSASPPVQPDRKNLIALFAGPPEPLRIAQDAASGVARPDRIEDWSITTREPKTAPPNPQFPPEPTVAFTTPSDQSAESQFDQIRPSTYKVQSGDTLSALAQRFLGGSQRYPELYEANRDVLSSPHSLREGMVLRIPDGG